MKRLTILAFIAFLFTAFGAQAQDNPECIEKYNLFRGDFKAKNYDRAYENWIWTMDNCPSLSVNIYKNGVTIAEYKYKNAPEGEKAQYFDLIKRVFDQRIEQKFEKDNLGKVYADYASTMEQYGASADEVFELMQKAFKTDPSKMGVKAIYKYFDEVVVRKKDTDVQYIFDTYDDVIEAVEKKQRTYQAKLDEYNAKQDAGNELTAKEAKYQKAYSTNLVALGQIGPGLDAKLASIASCDNLVALYSKNYEANKGDARWLKRAVSRMYNKKCTDASIYVNLVDSYQKVDPSPEASVFYASVLLQQGQRAKAQEAFKQAIEQETDNYKKAGYLYKVAVLQQTEGKKVAARNSAKQAIKLRPGLGDAYILIANLYATSANDCGTSVFEKKMTYVAALNYAERAKRNDPSISRKANKYIKVYAQNIPDKKLIFNEGIKGGTPFTVKCWINETVTIPAY